MSWMLLVGIGFFGVVAAAAAYDLATTPRKTIKPLPRRR